MIPALLRTVLPLIGFGAFILLVRQAYLRWLARKTWRRFEREARARHRAGRFLDDGPRRGEAVDIDFERVKR